MQSGKISNVGGPLIYGRELINEEYHRKYLAYSLYEY